MKRGEFLRNAVVLMCVLLSTTFLVGQAVNFAQIQGRVIDATGAILADAKVEVVGVATGLVRNATSGSD